MQTIARCSMLGLLALACLTTGCQTPVADPMDEQVATAAQGDPAYRRYEALRTRLIDTRPEVVRIYGPDSRQVAELDEEIRQIELQMVYRRHKLRKRLEAAEALRQRMTPGP